MMRERSVFQQAIEIAAPEARDAFVTQKCGDDPQLAERVRQLLAAASEMGDFLKDPIFESDETHVLDPLLATSEFQSPLHPAERSATDPLAPDQQADSQHDIGLRPRPGSDQQHALQQLKPFLEPSTEENSLGKLGHYEIEQLLGQGGFGIVLAARDMKLHRRVAIKILAPSLASTSPPRKRFLREARAAASIRHQNVVSVYSVEEEPIPYLVMELIEGETVQDRIDQAGPLDVSDLMVLGRQLLSGLAAAHAVGIVHRDIKPSNILIEDLPGQVLKITDFGLARTVDDAKLTQTGYTTGTPMYMSPEQALGRSVDARSDLFSVASVLYAMATGRAPFRAPSTVAVLKRVVEDTPRPIAEIVPEVPTWIESIIRSMHNKSPAQRFASAHPAMLLWQQCEDQWRSTAAISLHLQKQIEAIDPAFTLSRPTVTAAPDAAFALRSSGNQHSHRPRLVPAFAVAVALILVVAAILASGRLPRPKSVVGVGDTQNNLVADDKTIHSDPEANATADSQLPSQTVAIVPDSGSAASLAMPTEKPQSSGIRGVWADDAPPFAMIPFTPQQAAEHAQAWADYLMIPVEWKHPLGIRFRLIPPGEFLMGTSPQAIEKLVTQIPEGEHPLNCLKSESPKHRVVITQPIYLSVHEINQRQYSQIMHQNPSWFQPSNPEATDVELPEDCGVLPVERVSWLDAAEFCRKLSRREDLSPTYEIVSGVPTIHDNAIGYRLPTEAEWEFACLAGNQGPYATGDDEQALVGIANISNRFNRPLPVGSLGANGFGIFDMHGNVNEWVQDVWSWQGYPESAVGITIDPRGPRTEGFRVTRGGDYFYGSVDSRASGRYAATPELPPNYATGFRIAVPVTVRRGVAEPVPAEVKVLLGASDERLLQWVEEIGQDYIPVAMNPRHGSAPSLIDAIAIPNESKSRWQIHCVDDASADFETMWRTNHRPAWRMPLATQSSTTFRTVFLWVADIPFWQTWSGELDFIMSKASVLGVEGFSPSSIFAVHVAEGDHWTLTKVPIPGAEVRYLPDVSEAELVTLMEDFRTRGWRPIRLMQHVGFDEPRFAVMFRNNPHRLRWQYEAGLSEADFQSKRELQQSQAMLPSMIASSLNASEVHYRVVWSESRDE